MVMHERVSFKIPMLSVYSFNNVLCHIDNTLDSSFATSCSINNHAALHCPQMVNSSDHRKWFYQIHQSLSSEHASTISISFITVIVSLNKSNDTVLTCFNQKQSYVLVVPNLSIQEIISICNSMMTSA